MNFFHPRIAAGDTRHPSGPRPSLEKPPTSTAPLRAVIIEDELMVAWALENTLERLGHEVVDIYPSGEAALSAGLGDATLVIVDINLGDGMDGIATATELRRSTAVPIIFCTAYSDLKTRERALAAVADTALVNKPLFERDLENAIVSATTVRH